MTVWQHKATCLDGSVHVCQGFNVWIPDDQSGWSFFSGSQNVSSGHRINKKKIQF